MIPKKDCFGRFFPIFHSNVVYIRSIHNSDDNPIENACLSLKKDSGDYFVKIIDKEANILYSNKKEDFAKIVKKGINLVGIKNKEVEHLNNFSVSDIDCIWDADEEVLYTKKDKKNPLIKVTIS